MPRAASRKDVFVAGQIDEAARGDRFKALYLAGVSRATNFRILNGQGMKRRMGTWRRVAITNGASVGCEFTTDAGDIFKLIFSDEQLDVVDSTNAIIETQTSQPWTTAILDELYFTTVDDQLLVTHTSFWPQAVSVDEADVWTVEDFAFAGAPGGATAQPYWVYQLLGTTLQPSALTGSITLTASNDHFVAGHVDTIFRYHEREVLITAVGGPTSATGTVLQDLPPTVNVILTDSRGFLVDGSVQGLDSTAKGIVTARAALAGSGATFTADPNGADLWDGGGNVTVTNGGTLYVSGLVSVAAKYMLRGVQNTIVATTVTVVAGAITAVVFPATEEGFKPWAADVTFTLADTQLTIAMKDGLTGFIKGEYLVSADGGSKSIVGVGPTDTTPAAVLDWEEQAFSSVRGYPGSACFHRKRLYLLNWRDVPRAISASAAGFPDYHRVGANDGDGFLEQIPDYKGQRALHVVSADQGIVLSDKAAYYMPEYGDKVITPSTVEFRFISPIGASSQKPAVTEQGAMYIESGTKRIIGVVATGQVQIPWETADISAFWTELMTGPRALSADIGITDRPERYGYVVQDDGSLAVMRAEPAGSDVPLGWTPWTIENASIRSVFPAGGALYAIVEYEFETVTTWLLLQFDDELYLDLAEEFDLVSETANIPNFASAEVEVMSEGHWRHGEFEVEADGDIVMTDFPDGDYIAGFDMTTRLTFLPPTVEHPAYEDGMRHSVPVAWLKVHDTSTYSMNGVLNSAYRAGEDTDEAPTLRTETKRWGIMGRGETLAPDITQTIPSPLTVLGAQLRVHF